MTDKSIKEKCNQLYELIEKSKQELYELRKSCKHERIDYVNYSYRVGYVTPQHVCFYCGKLIDMEIFRKEV